MIKPKKGFIQKELNIERFTSLQWDGILRAMDAYAIHVSEVTHVESQVLQIKELKKIKKFYQEQNDWTSANQLAVAIDTVKNYYQNKKK